MPQHDRRGGSRRPNQPIPDPNAIPKAPSPGPNVKAVFNPSTRTYTSYESTKPDAIPKMPRSKFATKAYGPTKPKICEDQQLPPGILPPGPGATNTAHFLLVVSSTGGNVAPIAGTAILTRTANPTEYTGTASLGDYTVTLSLIAIGPRFAPFVTYTIRRLGGFITSGSTSADAPRSVDPYDTGILLLGDAGPNGQQMIRIVARE